MQRSENTKIRVAPMALARACALAAIVLALVVLGLPALAGETETVYAQHAGVTVYSSPHPASPVLKVLDRGDSLLSYGSEGEWFNVQVDVGGTLTNGWVHGSDIGSTSP